MGQSNADEAKIICDCSNFCITLSRPRSTDRAADCSGTLFMLICHICLNM